MSDHINYETIISSWLNGQKKQALSYIDEYGWVLFASDLKHDDAIEDKRKIVIFTSLIILKHS